MVVRFHGWNVELVAMCKLNWNFQFQFEFLLRSIYDCVLLVEEVYTSGCELWPCLYLSLPLSHL